MKSFKGIFWVILFQIFIVNKSVSQTLLSENFEGSFPTTGWTFMPEWSQNIYNFNSVSGNNSIRSYAPSFSNANTWAFFPALNLNAGVLYRISYWYRASTTMGYTEKFKLTLGSAAAVNNQTTIVHDYPSVTNRTYLQGVDTVTVPNTGNYNFAFHYYSSAGQAAIYLDSVVVKEIIPVPCTSSPVIGTAGGPSMVTADSIFTLTLSGNYSLLSGLQFQWQYSPAGVDNFQNIAGANNKTFNTSQNVNRDYRCVVTCVNGGSPVVSNIVNVTVAGSGSLFRDKHIGSTDPGRSINGMSFLSASTGYVAFSNKIGYTQDSGQSFIFRNVTQANTNFNGYSVNLLFGFFCNGIHAISSDTLVVYGNYGSEPSILYSSNAGQNWKLVFYQPFNGQVTNDIMDMKFPSNNLGVAISQKYIMESTNRGQTWSVKYQIPANRTSIFSSISMPSLNRGFVAAGNYIYRRTVGSWNELVAAGIPSDSGLHFNKIAFSTDNTGYVARDDDHSIYKTSDGGFSWTRMNDPIISGISASDLHFINDSTGFASVTAGYNVAKTSNSGRTWELCKRNSDYQHLFFGMNKLFFLNAQTAWAGGNGEFLMMTTTSGNPTLPTAIFSVDTTNLTPTGFVKLNSSSYSYYLHKWYVNGQLISSGVNASYTHDIYRLKDTIRLIVSNGIDSDTLQKVQNFHPYIQVPVINSFSPATATANTIVEIAGIGFNATNAVSFGDVPAKSFVVNSNSSITAMVGGGASGNVRVTTPSGIGTLPGFNFYLPPAPVIFSFFPENGEVGSIVNIYGSNFNDAADGNIVYFGNMRATILNAGSQSISCKVPAGASLGMIHVINKGNKLGAYTSKAFNVTFSHTAGIISNSFYNVLNIPADNVNEPSVQKYVYSASTGDINQDGKTDVICTVSTGWNNDSIYILKNNSVGNQISFERFKVVARGKKPCLGDLDNDGNLDIIYLVNDQLGMSRNKGNLSFAPPVFVLGGYGTEEIAVSDIDGDGRADILNAALNNSTLAVLRNVTTDSGLVFASKVEFAVGGATPTSLAVSDFDGDNKPDVAIGGASAVSVFKNTSQPETILFAPKIDLPATGRISKLFIADVNGDNKQDIITVYSDTYTYFSVFKNTSTNGVISFAARVDFSPGSTLFMESASINNFSGDSLPDMLIGNTNFNVHKNLSNVSGTINFITGPPIPTTGTWSLNSADFDGDGKQDFVNLNDNHTVRELQFFRNRIGENVDVLMCMEQADHHSITSNVNGFIFQWQVDTGSGFTNIVNNTIYTGANQSTLLLYGIPPTWYGNKYRCLVNGATYTYVFELKFQNKWTGAVSNAWENPANWSCGKVPNEYMDVLVPAGNVVISSNQIVRSLSVLSPASLFVNTGYQLTVIH